MLQCEGVKLLGYSESGGVLAGVRAMNPNLPQCFQLVFGVAERFGKAQSRGRGLHRRGDCTFGKQQRRAQRGLQLHLAAGIDRRVTFQSSERLFDAATAFLDQGQLHP